MEEKLQALRQEVEAALGSVGDEAALQNLKAKYVGRKGVLTEILKGMKDLSDSERPKMGKLVNETKVLIEGLFDSKFESLRDQKKKQALSQEKIDVTLPGRGGALGALHPVTQVMEEIIDIFQRMGFQVAEGPEVESDYYNFEALNMPRNHPARDMQDTFYVGDRVLLRSDT